MSNILLIEYFVFIYKAVTYTTFGFIELVIKLLIRKRSRMVYVCLQTCSDTIVKRLIHMTLRISTISFLTLTIIPKSLVWIISFSLESHCNKVNSCFDVSGSLYQVNGR